MFKILICDDSRINTEILSSSVLGCFPKINANITCLHSGEAAVKKAKEVTFDLIITDLEMPNGNGLFLITNVRANSLNRLTPILIWSGSEIENRGLFSVNAGANSWLTKPAELDEIKEKLVLYLSC